jgi:hypothetical protein
MFDFQLLNNLIKPFLHFDNNSPSNSIVINFVGRLLKEPELLENLLKNFPLRLVIDHGLLNFGGAIDVLWHNQVHLAVLFDLLPKLLFRFFYCRLDFLHSGDVQSHFVSGAELSILLQV